MGGVVPPDLYFRADSFSFQLQDSPFEANLKSNHMVCGVGVRGWELVVWCVEWGVWGCGVGVQGGTVFGHATAVAD